MVCFAFSVSPQALTSQMNRATSETQKDISDDEGLMPILAWIKRLCDHVIHMLGGENLEFVWRNDSVVDPTIQRENLVAYVGAGMITRRRAAELMGETLPDDPMADVLTVTTGQGVVRLGASEESGKRRKTLIRDVEFSSIDKYSIAQPRGPDGRWIGAYDVFASVGSAWRHRPFRTTGWRAFGCRRKWRRCRRRGQG